MNTKSHPISVLLILCSLPLSSCLKEKYEDYLNSLDLQDTDSIIDTGAGLINALDIEFESIAPNQVESVTGTVLTESYIKVASNGVEEGQNRAAIIFYDNNDAILNVPT